MKTYTYKQTNQFFLNPIKLSLVFLCTFLFLNGNVLGQTTIHSNDCASATAGWVFTNGTTTQAIQQGGYWLLEDADVITSEAFNVSSYTGGLTLTFQVGTYGTGTPNRPCLVEYSENNGTTWSSTTFTSATPTSATLINSGTFNISASSSTQFRLRFRKAVTGGRQGVRLDNILFQGTVSAAPTISLSSPSQTGASNIEQNDANNILSHFQAAITTANATLNTLAFTTTGSYNGTDLTGNFRLFYSTSSTFGSASSISSVAVGAAGTYTFTSISQVINDGATGYFWIVADASGTSGSNRTLTVSASPTLTFAAGTPTGTISAGGTKTFVSPTSPNITVGTITAFGNQCINTTSTERNYSVSGSNLTANIVITPPVGYQISLTSGSGFVSNPTTLSLTPTSGTVSPTTIYVRFAPTSAIVYNADITHSSTGATTQNVAASGTGINGTVAVTTVTATAITTTTASSGGNTLSTSCGTITAKGVVWGTTANPTVPSANSTDEGTGTANFTSSITGLTPGTTYFYRSYATNSNGVTSYGANLSFATLKLEPTNFPTSFACGTTTTSEIPLTWTAATGAVLPDGYLVKWSDVSYAAIPDPVDGTAESNGTGVQNVVGTSYTITGLTQDETYFIKIWSYTNSGTGINYKIGSEPQTSCATLAGPCLAQFNFTALPTGWASASVTYASNEAVFGANNGELATVSVSNPNSLTFDLRRTTNTNAKDLIVEVSTTTQGGTYTTVQTYNHGNTTAGTTTACVVDLTAYSTFGTVFIRFRKASSTTSPWYLRNVEVYCGPSDPVIVIEGSGFEIVNGDVTPNVSDFTDFGSTPVVGGTVVRVYDIVNTGGADLEVTSVTSSNDTEFAVSGISLPAIISPSGSTSFTVTFDPTAIGTRTSTITVLSDDTDKSPYTYLIQGNGTNSALSDIITNTGFTYTSNINYTGFQAATITNTSHSVGVFQFIIRDGGSAANDDDDEDTELTAITFEVANIANIRSAALFDGNTMLFNSPTINTGAGTITFTGLSGAGVTAADDGTKTVTLRVSFLTTVTDNDQLQFTVQNATANLSGSVFANPNAGGATSSITGDRNRIEVTADRIAFVQQPSNTGISTIMSPAVTVQSIDVNGNRDLDNTSSISITSTAGADLVGTPVVINAINGLATFSSLTHTATGTFTLSATATTPTLTASAPSSSYIISTFGVGTFRTSTTGTTNWATLSNWETFNGTTWVAASSIPNNSADVVYINRDFNVTCTGGPKYIVGQINVDNNSVLTINASSGGCSSTPGLDVHVGVKVFSGSSIIANATLSFQNSSTLFELEDNANLTINYNANGNSLVWEGIENFAPNSTVTIGNWNVGASTPDLFTGSNITTNVYGGFSAAFGNININSSLISGTWVLMQTSTSNNLCHGNLIITNSNAQLIRITDLGITTTIGNNIIKNNTGIFEITNASATVTVKGNIELNTGTIRTQSTTGRTSILNIDGDIIVNNTSAFIVNQNIGTSIVTLNLKGDLTVAAGASFSTNDTDGSTVNFDGTTTQIIECASVINGGNDGGTTPFSLNIKNGAYVQLNNNLVINGRTTLTVESGGTFDFGFNGSTALLVTQPVSPSGTNRFTSNQGSILKITSPDGIVGSVTANLGNVQLPVSNKTFNQTATFHYIGKANQVTGNAITSGSTGKIVICELEDNTLTLTPSNNIAMSNGTILDALGGRLEIRRGIVVETSAATITGSGRLVMTDGTFRSNILATTLPQLANYGAYSLSGGTVELNGNGGQIISGAPAGGYFNVAITNAGTKTVTSTFNISNNLNITDGIFDPANNSITGDAGLTMTGGRFRLSRLNQTLPELTGISTPYAITGGTLELYGTGATQTHSLRGTFGASSSTITYHNIELNANAANVGVGSANVVAGAGFNLSGTMTVNSPTCFQLASTFTIGDAGTSAFLLTAGSTLKYGGTIAASGATGNIRTDNRTFPTTASYGFIGATNNQNPGTGLPTSMVNMYLDKAANETVLLQQNTSITNLLDLQLGRLNLNSYTLNLGTTTSDVTITGANDYSYVITWASSTPVGEIIHQVNSNTGTYEFPVGDDSYFTPASVTFSAGTLSNSTLSGAVRAEAHPNLGSAMSYINRYWSINENDIVDPEYGVEFDYVDSDVEGDDGILYPFKYNAAGWIGCIESPAVYTSGSGSHNALTNKAVWTGLDVFSDFTAIGDGSPLPIELLNFTAIANKQVVDLEWITASETNNNYFTVERSQDAINFEEVLTKAGAGNSNQVLYYQDNDKDPHKGISYYRLKQTDFNGDFSYSNLVVVQFGNQLNFDAVVFGNAYNSEIAQIKFLNNEKPIQIDIIDVSGRIVFSEQVVSKDIQEIKSINFQNFKQGLYLLRFTSGEMIVVKRWVR